MLLVNYSKNLYDVHIDDVPLLQRSLGDSGIWTHVAYYTKLVFKNGPLKPWAPQP